MPLSPLFALMPDIPILMPLLVACCLFSPLLLSLLEVNRASDASGPDADDGPSTGGVPSPPPVPVQGDACAVKVDHIELVPAGHAGAPETQTAVLGAKVKGATIDDRE